MLVAVLASVHLVPILALIELPYHVLGVRARWELLVSESYGIGVTSI